MKEQEEEIQILAHCKSRLSALANGLDEGKQRCLASVIMDLDDLVDQKIYSNERFMRVVD